jgi:hypothetical protein
MILILVMLALLFCGFDSRYTDAMLFRNLNLFASDTQMLELCDVVFMNFMYA